MSQMGDMLMTLTSAINTVREYRNATRPPSTAQPISDAPFSVRIKEVTSSGGPAFEWTTSTVASPSNFSVSASQTAVVKFVTKYARSETGFSAYTLSGQLELRNNQDHPVQLEVGAGWVGGRGLGRVGWMGWGGRVFWGREQQRVCRGGPGGAEGPMAGAGVTFCVGGGIDPKVLMVGWKGLQGGW